LSVKSGDGALAAKILRGSNYRAVEPVQKIPAGAVSSSDSSVSVPPDAEKRHELTLKRHTSERYTPRLAQDVPVARR
jgi:hypothetical protein